VNTTLKISIVTPSFNQGNFIEETIKSVYNQGYPLFEHIVIDGESTDITVDVLRRYPHLKWVSEKDRGQSHATNKGLKIAQGDIIGWLNSDDLYYSGVFHKVNDIFVANPAIYMIYGAAVVIDENGKILFKRYPSEVTFRKMINKGYSMLIQPSVFFRRDIIEHIGYMDESISLGMDYDFWLRIMKKYECLKVDELFSYYRINSKGGTIINRKKDIISGLKICRKNIERVPLITYLNIFSKYIYYIIPGVSQRLNRLNYNFKK
jgi:glycosyltransferase involved in cell wall biosynthesis